MIVHLIALLILPFAIDALITLLSWLRPTPEEARQIALEQVAIGWRFWFDGAGSEPQAGQLAIRVALATGDYLVSVTDLATGLCVWHGNAPVI